MAIGYKSKNLQAIQSHIEKVYYSYFRLLYDKDILEAWGTTNHPEEVV